MNKSSIQVNGLYTCLLATTSYIDALKEKGRADLADKCERDGVSITVGEILELSHMWLDAYEKQCSN